MPKPIDLDLDQDTYLDLNCSYDEAGNDEAMRDIIDSLPDITEGDLSFMWLD